jgi:predicted transposase YbfD/YdcC
VDVFVHHLIRHDTVDCKKWLYDHLPSNTPLFQQEIMTIWSGTASKRKGTGVLKIYSDLSNAPKLTEIFRQHLNNKNHSHFLSKEYFNTLDTQQKKQYVMSQIEYQHKYRMIKVAGIRSIELPTKKRKMGNMYLSTIGYGRYRITNREASSFKHKS